MSCGMTIVEQALSFKEYIAGIHHEIHENPELSLREFRTTRRIKEEISGLGLVVKEYEPTGLHVDIKGNLADNGIIVGLRSDIDALPVCESETACPRSRNEGVMHACGHDGHVSIGLTVAEIIANIKDNLKGSIRFIFQPAEEGSCGALPMVYAGACNNITHKSPLHIFKFFYSQIKNQK